MKYIEDRKFNVNINFEIKYIFFAVILITLIIILIKSRIFTTIQRWFLWILIAGIIGNTINSQDIIEIKFITFLPLFNIADLAVAISTIIVLLSLLIKDRSFN